MSAVAVADPTVASAGPDVSVWTAAGKRALTTFGRSMISLGTVVALWQLVVWSWGEDLAFSTRGPLDVGRYLADGANAEARRAILDHLVVTLGHAGLGLGLGTLAAVLLAVLFNAFGTIEQAILPVAMVLRSVPLVAMAPLIALVFGRGLVTVAIVGATVTFFPTLVNVNLGLRMAPQPAIDLVKAYGGRKLFTLARVQFPFALPALFAALRATAPLAITGAMLAEFFLVGNGLGHSINLARNQFDYTDMWAQAAVATLASVLIYSIAVGVEGAVLARFAPERAVAARTRA